MVATGRVRLVVVGDALLDADLVGRAARVAPDAPVPVLDELEETLRPGGAGLAAALAAADGHEVTLVTALAEEDRDEGGRALRRLLADAGVRVLALPLTGSTPVKRRVRSAGQSLLRLDSGGGTAAEPPAEALSLLADELAAADAALVSDYGRGITGLAGVRELLARATTDVPVVWDPHPRGSEPVPGVRLATPNRAEAADLAARHRGAGTRTGLGAVDDDARTLVEAWRAHGVAITLGPGGALLSHGESSPSVIPAPPTAVADPCGAGDRMASAAAVALGAGALPSEAVLAGVVAASAFLGAGGAASYGAVAGAPGAAGSEASEPTEPAGLARVERVRAAGGTVVATGGCFDLLHAGHVATLTAARALGDCLVVCVNSDDSVRRLKGESRPLVPAADRVRVLEALEPVDAVVVFEEDTPVEALRTLRPDVWAKGGDYAGAELPEARLLAEWGGQSVVLPYLDGRSTTQLVTTAAARAAGGR
jgi:rfaE bifunctional protein nucleotidyltransferase chain/domain/rfaE bifunctional protein kinase chain/domain